MHHGIYEIPPFASAYRKDFTYDSRTKVVSPYKYHRLLPKINLKNFARLDFYKGCSVFLNTTKQSKF